MQLTLVQVPTLAYRLSFFFALALGLPRHLDSEPLAVLSASQINAFTPYTYYASNAYCSPLKIMNWTCGVGCDARPEFIPLTTGGTDKLAQWFYVGYDPLLHQVVLSHQGTSNIFSILDDINIVLQPLPANLFPEIPSNVKVSTGFAFAQSQTASKVLEAVTAAIAKYSTNQVVAVGHSLGAAISLLDAIFLASHLPPAIKVQSVDKNNAHPPVHAFSRNRALWPLGPSMNIVAIPMKP